MFNGKVWTFEELTAQFEKDKSVRFIEPMSSHEVDIRKYVANVDDIAELKYDGHRGLIFIGWKNRAFSRNISKKTGWYGENTDCIPHIRDLHLPTLYGTVLDGEFDYGNTSMGVQSVMGSLPERAIAFQEENGYIPFKAFDIIYYKGVNVQKLPLWKRKIYLAMAIMEILKVGGEEASWYFIYATMYMTKETREKFLNLVTYYDYDYDGDVPLFIHNRIVETRNYGELFKEFVAQEKEGIMLKDMYGIYEQKRSKNYLKVKGQSTWDCVVMGYTKPTKEYDGKELATWSYWETPDGEKVFDPEVTEGQMLVNRGYIPITKPYFKGWCGAIEFGVWKPMDLEAMYKADPYPIESMLDQMRDEGVLYVDDKGNHFELVHVGDCKGLAEKELENIRINGDDLIGTVLEVKANGIIDEEIGSLRHPRFSKWRKDKNSEQCVWDDHIRKMGE